MMIYNEFKRLLQISNKGDTADRNRANGKLLDFRSKSPEKYKDYTEKIRAEVHNKGVIHW